MNNSYILKDGLSKTKQLTQYIENIMLDDDQEVEISRKTLNELLSYINLLEYKIDQRLEEIHED